MTKNKTNIMVGKEILLRKLEMSDATSMYENWASDNEVTKYVCWNTHSSVEETKSILKKWINNYQTSNFYLWGIVVKNSNELIGTISVVETNKNKNICEIGYCIGKRWWGKGYATKAVEYVSNYLMQFCNFETLIIKVQSLNKASIAVAKKVGYEYYLTESKSYMDKTTGVLDDILVYKLEKNKHKMFNCLKYKHNSPTFEEIINFGKNITSKYLPIQQEIRNQLYNSIENKDVDKYKKLSCERKICLKNILNEIIDFFPQIKMIPMTIYLSGSYARNSFRVNSDVDLNFCYPNKYIKSLIVIEDIFAYYLVNCYNIDYRDRIHPMGYLLMTDKNKLTKSNNYITLFKDNNMIINECRKESYEIMYEYYNIPRSHRDISKYLGNANNVQYLNEYCCNNEIVFSNTKNHISETIRKTDNDNIKNKSYDMYQLLNIKKLISDISSFILTLDNNIQSIRDIKKFYKTLPCETFYNICMLVRKIALKDNNQSEDGIKIDQFFNNSHNIDKNIMKELEEKYYTYIFELNKLEKVFYDNKINFSSHSNDNDFEILGLYKKIMIKNYNQGLN